MDGGDVMDVDEGNEGAFGSPSPIEVALAWHEREHARLKSVLTHPPKALREASTPEVQFEVEKTILSPVKSVASSGGIVGGGEGGASRGGRGGGEGVAREAVVARRCASIAETANDGVGVGIPGEATAALERAAIHRRVRADIRVEPVGVLRGRRTRGAAAADAEDGAAAHVRQPDALRR